MIAGMDLLRRNYDLVATIGSWGHAPGARL